MVTSLGNCTLTLDEENPTQSIPEQLLEGEPARVSRYLMMSRLIRQIIGDDDHAKILDVGGAEGLLREFGIKSTIIDVRESDAEDFLQGDALNMPYEDNSFDVVVSCDVLEHIPAPDREKFVSEMVRVSKGFAVLCAPFDQGGVSASENQANSFFKDIADDDHPWLIEHIENGLPDRTSIEKFISDQKWAYTFFKHFSLDLWDATTRIHFLHAVFGDSSAIDDLNQKISARYYETLCDLDFSEQSYRTFCVINKNEQFEIDLPSKEIQAEAKSRYNEFLDREVLLALKNFAIERREQQLGQKYHEDAQDEKIKELTRELADATHRVNDIEESTTYRVASKLAKVKKLSKK